MSVNTNRFTTYLATFAALCLIATAAFAGGDGTTPETVLAAGGPGWGHFGAQGRHAPMGPHQGPGQYGRGRGGQQQLFAVLDANADGKLTRSEVETAWQRLYDADTDGDGAITLEELRQNRPGRAGRGQGQRGQRPRFGRMFEQFDNNHDGKLTANEVPRQAWDRLSQADADGDGAVTLDELRQSRPGAGRGQAQRGQRPRFGRMFEQFDKNEDGKLTANEVAPQVWERLSQADADGDGAVTLDELRRNRPGRGGPGQGRMGRGYGAGYGRGGHGQGRMGHGYGQGHGGHH